MRSRSKRLAMLVAVSTLALAGPGTASALAVGNPVINDCYGHGQLTHAWTHAQLEQALRVMPQSIKEYTNCYDVIHRALAAAVVLGGGSGGSGGGGSFLPVPVIVILVLLLGAMATFAVIALRGRRKPE